MEADQEAACRHSSVTRAVNADIYTRSDRSQSLVGSLDKLVAVAACVCVMNNM